MEQQIMYAFDLIGTVVFAITGAVRGVRLKLDLLGVIVFACTVGVGGGMMRDTIIGAVPVAALKDETYLIVCILTGILIFFTARWVAPVKRLITFCDALGLGVFTALGAAKGMSHELAFIGIVLTGVLTAVGGGVIRDILAGRIPVVLTSDFYATASLFGGVLFYFLAVFSHLPTFYLFLIVTCFVTGIRIAAIHFRIHLPVAGKHVRTPRKLPPGTGQ